MQRDPQLTLFACLALGACAHDASVLVEKPARPSSCDVRVYGDEELVDGHFERVCVIPDPVDGGMLDEEAMQIVRRRACKCGANAVVLDPVSSPVPGVGYGLAVQTPASLSVRNR